MEDEALAVPADAAADAAAATTTTTAVAAVHSSNQPPGAVLSEAATSLLASNKAKRRALGASLESLLATFRGNNAAGDAAPTAAPSSSSSLPLDPRFAPLVRRARAQRAALFALSRGVPLSPGLMAAVDGVEVVDGSNGSGDNCEPYFYSEPVGFFFSLHSCGERKHIVLWEKWGGERGARDDEIPSF